MTQDPVYLAIVRLQDMKLLSVQGINTEEMLWLPGTASDVPVILHLRWAWP